MIDFDSGDAWKERLKPVGESTWEKESFSAWWERHSVEFTHLDPQVLEQWVHRHWYHSRFRRLPLERLRSRREFWPTERILKEVYNDDHIAPEHDFKAIADVHTGEVMLATGTWDYPMLILNTPDGFKDWSGEHPDVRFRLIEGHRRFRFLNALFHRKQGLPLHEVIIIKLTLWRDFCTGLSVSNLDACGAWGVVLKSRSQNGA